MRIRYSLVIAFLVAAVAAACGTDPPQRFDWCYFYNFATSSYEAAIPYGSWTTIGGVAALTTDSSGRLSFSISHSSAVQARYVTVTATRAEDSVGDVSIVAGGNIYGVPIGNNGPGDTSSDDPNYTATFPFALDSVNIGFPAENATDFSSSMNVSISASQPIRILRIYVSGNGVNPFPVDNCSPNVNTNTPRPEYVFDTDTPVPTLTNTVEASDTPLPSATPTATATPSSCCEFVGFEGSDDLDWTEWRQYAGPAYSLVTGHTGLGYQMGAPAVVEDVYQNTIILQMDKPTP